MTVGWTCRGGRRRARAQRPIKIIRRRLIPSRTQTSVEITPACNGFMFTVVLKLCESSCMVAFEGQEIEIRDYFFLPGSHRKYEYALSTERVCSKDINQATLFYVLSRFATKVILPEGVLKSYASTQFMITASF